MYSSFRTPPANRQRPPVLNGYQTVSGAVNPYAYGGYSSSTLGRRTEGIYAAPAHLAQANYPRQANWQPEVHGYAAVNRSPSTVGVHSKLGNGFNTLPSNLYRGVRTYDPLNNVNRFSKRQSDLADTGSLNNFDYYRSQQTQSSSATGRPPSPTTDYDSDDRMSYPQSKLAPPEHSAMTRGKPPPENKPSLLLSPDENRFIFEILGRGRQVIYFTQFTHCHMIYGQDRSQEEFRTNGQYICMYFRHLRQRLDGF